MLNEDDCMGGEDEARDDSPTTIVHTIIAAGIERVGLN